MVPHGHGESDNNDILNLYFSESVANGDLKAELADELTDADGRKAYGSAHGSDRRHSGGDFMEVPCRV